MSDLQLKLNLIVMILLHLWSCCHDNTASSLKLVIMATLLHTWGCLSWQHCYITGAHCHEAVTILLQVWPRLVGQPKCHWRKVSKVWMQWQHQHPRPEVVWPSDWGVSAVSQQLDRTELWAVSWVVLGRCRRHQELPTWVYGVVWLGVAVAVSCLTTVQAAVSTWHQNVVFWEQSKYAELS